MTHLKVQLIFFLRNVHAGCGAHPSCSMGTGFLPDTKRPEREINLVPASSTDVENTWCYASFLPPPPFHGVDKDKFAFWGIFV